MRKTTSRSTGDATAQANENNVSSNGNGIEQHAGNTATRSVVASANSARTTVVLPVALDENLEVYSLKVGVPKGEIIKQLIANHLVTQGLQPDRRPRSIEVTY